MRRLATAAGLTAALGLGMLALVGWTGDAGPAGRSHAKATTLTVWVGWSQRELREFKKVVAEYDAKHSDVTIKVVGSINDDKITAAIRSGNAPDVVSSFTSANVGVYCGTGA
jgi:multiple sugar transport system substrate-binding protein